jgi:tetraacyldisaccharide 4'-kinase
MKKTIYFWIERYLFNPNKLQKIIAFLLLPITFIYCFIVIFKRKSSKAIDYNIPIISIGNLVVGGSGKTPITISLASKYPNSAIILRGYGRDSSGMKMVSKDGEIFLNVKESGDEAMLLAISLPQSMVIVSEDRVEGILKAKKEGAKIIFLDDGFNKSKINKFDILIKPQI